MEPVLTIARSQLCDMKTQEQEIQICEDVEDMQDHRISVENSSKLDRVIQLLEGDGPDAPGLKSKVATHDSILMGERGNNGLVQRVNIMWKVHIWLLCTLSGIVGFILKASFDKLIKS